MEELKISNYAGKEIIVSDYIRGLNNEILYISSIGSKPETVLSIDDKEVFLNDELRKELIRLLKKKDKPKGLALLLADYPTEDEIDKPTYEQVLELKKEYETEMYRQPKKVFSGVFYRKDDRRILQPALFLAECGVPYSEQKFKDYLAKKSIPLKYIKAINKSLEANYEEKGAI